MRELYKIEITNEDGSVERLEVPWMWLARFVGWVVKRDMRKRLREGEKIVETEYKL